MLEKKKSHLIFFFSFVLVVDEALSTFAAFSFIHFGTVCDITSADTAHGTKKRTIWLTTASRVCVCVLFFIPIFLVENNIPKRIELKKTKSKKISRLFCKCMCVHIKRKLTNIANQCVRIHIHLHLFNILFALYMSSSNPKTKSLLLLSVFSFSLTPPNECTHQFALAIWLYCLSQFFGTWNTHAEGEHQKKTLNKHIKVHLYITFDCMKNNIFAFKNFRFTIVRGANDDSS